MHDPIYRLSVAWQNVSYNQPAHPGFFLGHGMTSPQRANIRTVRAKSDGPQATSDASAIRKVIPDKSVVLTFDDSSKSHFTVVRPLLKQYGFGATFFITEGFDFPDNKRDYMTWEEITQLHQDGFEIGNHTRDHLGITDRTVGQLDEQLRGIEQKCQDCGIPKPTSFAWPGNAITQQAFAILNAHGIRFARRGGAPEYPYEKGRGFAYEPGVDHPLMLPSAGDARPDWTLDDLIRAVEQAQNGRVAILQFHGTPDTAHSWVNTPQQNFEAFMKYLAVNEYNVVALRDLNEYVDADVKPTDPQDIVRRRKQLGRDVKEEDRG